MPPAGRLPHGRGEDHARLPAARAPRHPHGRPGLARRRPQGEAERLAACYRNSLRLATEHEIAGIAFPCIGTGIYGYPADEAAAVAVRTVRGLPAAGVDEVIFCCFSADDVGRYRALLGMD